MRAFPVVRLRVILVLVATSSLAATGQVKAQSESPIKLVEKVELPSGMGLAEKFAGDQRIESHSAVIFADDFEASELGAKRDETNNRGGNVLSYVDESSSISVVGRRSLKVVATLGKNNGGGFTKWFESSERLFIRFYTKFDRDGDYIHHFCTLRANKSLQGGDRWSGFGGAGEAPNGEDRFSTAIEPWGNWGKWTPPGRWNFYSYWHTMQASPDGKFWGNGFRPESQPDIVRDEWMCDEFMLQHNTPGRDDGEQA